MPGPSVPPPSRRALPGGQELPASRRQMVGELGVLYALGDCGTGWRLPSRAPGIDREPHAERFLRDSCAYGWGLGA